MSKIRTVIVDDEKSSINTISKLISKYTPEVEVCGTAQSVDEAIETIDSMKPDLVFLDINMPDGDGFEVIENTVYKNYKVIFTTAYDNYAIRAFEFSALHYLLKPVRGNDLKDAVNRFEQNYRVNEFNGHKIGQKFDRIILPSSNGMNIINVDDIIRCESSNNYTTFYLKNGKSILVSKSINNYEQMFSDLHFARIHNKHIVNLKYITKYVKGRGGYVIMINGDEVDVSEGKRKEFLEKLNYYARK